MRRVPLLGVVLVSVSLSALGIAADEAVAEGQDRPAAAARSGRRTRRQRAEKAAETRSEAARADAARSDAARPDAARSDAARTEPARGAGRAEAGRAEAEPDAPETTQTNADSEIVERDGQKVKVMRFSGLGVDGRLKSPQLLHFVNRVRAEFDRPSLPHRSFRPELERSTREGSF